MKTPNLSSDRGKPNRQWRQRWSIVIVDLETGHDVSHGLVEAPAARREVERSARRLADGAARDRGRPASTFGYRIEIGALQDRIVS
jgi:hypothetical protein